MIKVRLQIGDGNIVDTADNYGLIYLSADSVFAAPDKGFETTSYVEEEGEHSSNSTVAEAFDYKVRFLIKANGNLGNANAVIARFNSLLYTQEEDVKTYTTVAFYNDYKGVKIVGRPSLIASAESFWRDSQGKEYDIVEVEWAIRVSEPSLCDFNIPLSASYPDSGGSGGSGGSGSGGSTSVDLSNYYTKSEVNNLVETESDRAVAEEQRLLTLINTKYSKPKGGIPQTDLSQDVTKWMVQPDWNEEDSTSPSFINNKPTISGGGEVVSGVSGVKGNAEASYRTGDVNITPDNLGLATVAISGSYNDLNNKPTIPSAVTESTVSGWGFTKYAGVPVVEVNSQLTADYSLQPNTYYRLNGGANGLLFTLATPTDNTIVNEYVVEFSSVASVADISFSTSIVWANGEAPTFENPTVISIINGLGVWAEFKRSL